jgi:ribonuclease J
MAALSRIAGGDHKDLHIIPGDTVVFSSSPIPGNGIMIDHVVNLLTRAGADVVTNTILNDIHSSGHPAKEELRLVLKLFKPKYFMPMHGEYRMLRIHGELATTVGIPAENVFVLNNGDSLTLTRGKVTRGYPVEFGNTYIDGKDIKGLADSVMEDRRILTDDGMLAITIALDTKRNVLMTKPEFSSMGMIGLKQTYCDELTHMLEVAISEKLLSKPSFADIKFLIKSLASAYIFNKTHREPMIIPIIMAKN